jgi:hypothetical protein
MQKRLSDQVPLGARLAANTGLQAYLLCLISIQTLDSSNSSHFSSIISLSANEKLRRGG